MHCRKTIVWVFLAGFLLVTGSLFAQNQGRIIGLVMDASNGEYLPGANIVLVGTYLGASTMRDGDFVVENVPYGTYDLKVSYIGYKDLVQKVTVSEAQPVVKLVLKIQQTAVKGGEVTVVGFREGQMKALSQQMSAVNIKNVVSREEMEKFPDMNTADALKRVPGINIQRSLGEGRFVYLRGTEPRMTNITVDGQAIASPQDEERFIGLDVVNASQLAEIQVTKALTPDMDGDAIGGTINLVTRSAFDNRGQVLKLEGGSGYSNLPDDPLYRGSLTYSNLLGKKKNFGITVSGNWYRNNIGAHSDEFDWGNETDVVGNTIPFALQDLRFFNYNTQRNHTGFSSALEYRVNDNNRFFIRGNYNRRSDDQTRNMVRVRVSKGDYLNANTVSKARMAYEMQDRNEVQLITSVIGGAKHKFGKASLDYTVSYSYARETKDDPGQIKSEFQLDQKVNLQLDLANVDFPKYTITNLDAGYALDPSHWEIDNQDFRKTFTNNKKFLSDVNFKYAYNLSGYPGNLKLGSRIKVEKKSRDSQRWKYKWKGSQSIFMDQFADNSTIKDFLQGHYVFGPIENPDKFFPFFFQFRAQNDGLREQVRVDDSDGLGGKYDATEDIYAAYAMTTVNVDKLMILAGFRDEYTRTTYNGIQLNFDSNGDFLNSEPAKQKNNYNDFFPNVQLRYRLTPRANFRLAFTKGISRPNYFDLAPYRWVFPENSEIQEGNPNLGPTRSINYDVMFELYPKGVGILSGGFFYKHLTDVSYTRFFRQVGGAFDGFLVQQPVNGGNANLYGFEFAASQQFGFLPGFLSGFGFFGNYTHAISNAHLQFRQRSILPGQAGDVANLGLSYEKYGLTARLSWNYNGRILDQVGETSDFDRFIDNHYQLDFSSSYRIMEGLNVYLQMVNITNEPQREYFGIPSRPRLNEYYSWELRSGLKFTL